MGKCSGFLVLLNILINQGRIAADEISSNGCLNRLNSVVYIHQIPVIWSYNTRSLLYIYSLSWLLLVNHRRWSWFLSVCPLIEKFTNQELFAPFIVVNARTVNIMNVRFSSFVFETLLYVARLICLSDFNCMLILHAYQHGIRTFFFILLWFIIFVN